MKNFFHLTEERGNGYGKKVIRYAFRIAENGEARNFYAEELNAIWNDTYISLSRNYDRDFTAKIDRETLVYSEGGTWLSDPNSTKFELECQITNNITAKAKRWKKEADDYKKAQTKAKKAKNLI